LHRQLNFEFENGSPEKGNAATGAPQEWWNCAFVTRPLSEPAAALRRAATFFDERRQPFVVRIRDGVDPASESACVALGMQYTNSVPGTGCARFRSEQPAPKDSRSAS